MIIILNSRNYCVKVSFEIKYMPEILNIQVDLHMILTEAINYVVNIVHVLCLLSSYVWSLSPIVCFHLYL